MQIKNDGMDKRTKQTFSCHNKKKREYEKKITRKSQNR